MKDFPLDYRLWYQVRELLLNSRRRRRAPRKVAAFISLYTGLRRSEIVAIRWEDFDEYRSVFYVRRRKKKAAKVPVAVLLPVHQELRVILDERKQLKKPLAHWYIVSSAPKPVHIIAISNGFRRWAQRELLYVKTASGRKRRLRFHDLRHLFALRLLQVANSIETVRRILGHSDPRTTLRYLDVIPEEELREVIMRL